MAGKWGGGANAIWVNVAVAMKMKINFWCTHNICIHINICMYKYIYIYMYICIYI
jgi:hypothetical protein